MAASLASIEDLLHKYLDTIEDVELDALLRLGQRLSRLTPMQWLSLSRGQLVQELARVLTVELLSSVGSTLVPTAIQTAGQLSGQSEKQIRQAISRAADQRGLSAIMPPESMARAARATQAALVAPLASVQSQIDRLIADIPPTSPERAARLLDRIRTEVIQPLRGSDQMRQAVSAAVGSVSQRALAFADIKLREPRLTGAAAEAAAANRPMRWVAALVRTCPDCLPRHGQMDRWESWQMRGLPRSGWSVCSASCKCVLIPEDATGFAAAISPLKREAAKLVADGSPRGLSVRIPPDLLDRESRGLVSRQQRTDELRALYGDDIRVRRALRLLGQINAGE